MSGNRILMRRLWILALSGVAAAVALGLMAKSPVALFVGLLVLGTGLIAGLLFFVLRPVPAEPLPAEFPDPEAVAQRTEENASPIASANARPKAPVVDLAEHRRRV